VAFSVLVMMSELADYTEMFRRPVTILWYEDEILLTEDVVTSRQDLVMLSVFLEVKTDIGTNDESGAEVLSSVRSGDVNLNRMRFVSQTTIPRRRTRKDIASHDRTLTASFIIFIPAVVTVGDSITQHQ
jgi:hypothetical protein